MHGERQSYKLNEGCWSGRTRGVACCHGQCRRAARMTEDGVCSWPAAGAPLKGHSFCCESLQLPEHQQGGDWRGANIYTMRGLTLTLHLIRANCPRSSAAEPWDTEETESSELFLAVFLWSFASWKISIWVSICGKKSSFLCLVLKATPTLPASFSSQDSKGAMSSRPGNIRLLYIILRNS